MATETVELYSAYLGLVKFSVDHETDEENTSEYVTLQSNGPQNFRRVVTLSSDTAFQQEFDNGEHTFESIRERPAHKVDRTKNKACHDLVYKLRQRETKTLTEEEKMQFQEALEELSVVDIHFNTLEFLQMIESLGYLDNRMFPNGVYSIANFKKSDSAFNYDFVDAIYYGSGDTLTPLVTADLVSHELGHSITFALVALEYEGESGALSEHFSDVFAMVYEHWLYTKYNENNNKSDDLTITADWIVGEELAGFKPKPRLAYRRNFMQPTVYEMPQVYQGPFWRDTDPSAYDQGGVHFNSGVGNHWFYLVSQEIGVYCALDVVLQTMSRMGTRQERQNAIDTESVLNFRYADYAKALLRERHPVHRFAITKALDVVGLGTTRWPRSRM